MSFTCYVKIALCMNISSYLPRIMYLLECTCRQNRKISDIIKTKDTFLSDLFAIDLKKKMPIHSLMN